MNIIPNYFYSLIYYMKIVVEYCEFIFLSILINFMFFYIYLYIQIVYYKNIINKYDIINNH